MNPRSLVVNWVVPMALLSLFVLAASEFVASPWVVVGRSMAPALQPGDRVVVDRWTYRQRRPRVGEVALLRGDDGTTMVKRIVSVGAGGFWVEGDHRAASRDSRQFGRVSAGQFRGRVVGRLWPPGRLGFVR